MVSIKISEMLSMPKPNPKRKRKICVNLKWLILLIPIIDWNESDLKILTKTKRLTDKQYKCFHFNYDLPYVRHCDYTPCPSYVSYHKLKRKEKSFNGYWFHWWTNKYDTKHSHTRYGNQNEIRWKRLNALKIDQKRSA